MRYLPLLAGFVMLATGCATANDCGAQALASAMDHRVDVKTLYAQTYTPGRGGALPSDMLGASRRHGFEPQLVSSWQDLQRRLHDGQKVIVLQNRRFDWWPQWHYAVVTGFDPVKDTVAIEGEPVVKRDAFMNMWRDGRQWGLALLPATSRL